MTRPNEFSRGTKIAAKQRATVNGVIHCEGCGNPIKGSLRVDHIRAAGLYGSSLLSNAQVLGECCYAEKDAADNAVVKRCKRIEAATLAPMPEGKLRSRGFSPPPPKPSPGRPTSKTLPRRPL